MAENNASVPLNHQSESALDNLTQLTGNPDRADLVNCAVRVYNLLATDQAKGKEVYIHTPGRQIVTIRKGRAQSNADELWQLLKIL